MPDQSSNPVSRQVTIHAGRVSLMGDLTMPLAPADGLVVFAHGSGSSRLSPRNQSVADSLVRAQFATLLFDLLSHDEEVSERYTRHLRFDIPLLADRLIGTLRWIAGEPMLSRLPVGLFGASTGAAAALIAAARVPYVATVISRGGRPDLADHALAQVRCPTLLIVGGNDIEVLDLNHRAMQRMTAPAKLHVVRGASHLFEEPGALDEVTAVATRWFRLHLAPPPRTEVRHV